MQKEWFSEWFGSIYYPILYGNRNHEEAQIFIKKISKHLQIPPQSKVLDLACGRGRHAIELNRLGYNVRGWDISKESIEDAKKYENEHLKFTVLDMRQNFPEQDFDAIMNLFTSFGYFECLDENLLVLQNIAKGLKKDGKWVIDFLNPNHVRRILIPFEEKILQNISFKISKSIENGFVYKHIHITDKNKEFHFSERVQLIEIEEFKTMFSKARLSISEIWGEYDGSPFSKETSSRLIFIGKK